METPRQCVFHPRDLHFCKNSPKRLKYCFSICLNSLFMCLRSLAESCRNQNPVILKVSDMVTENISGRVSGLCGRMKVMENIDDCAASCCTNLIPFMPIVQADPTRMGTGFNTIHCADSICQNGFSSWDSAGNYAISVLRN